MGPVLPKSEWKQRKVGRERDLILSKMVLPQRRSCDRGGRSRLPTSKVMRGDAVPEGKLRKIGENAITSTKVETVYTYSEEKHPARKRAPWPSRFRKQELALLVTVHAIIALKVASLINLSHY